MAVHQERSDLANGMWGGVRTPPPPCSTSYLQRWESCTEKKGAEEAGISALWCIFLVSLSDFGTGRDPYPRKYLLCSYMTYLTYTCNKWQYYDSWAVNARSIIW